MIYLKDEEATQYFARSLAKIIENNCFIVLNGDLGAGKSCFARAFIQEKLGKEIEVLSPTFSIVQEYESANLLIYHCDFYRIKDGSEILQLDLPIVRNSNIEAISLVEWSDVAKAYIKTADITINFTTPVDKTGRILSINTNKKYEFFFNSTW